MKSSPRERRFALAIAAVLVLAAAVRIWGIEERPLHHDEAINSIQLDRLWTKGTYRYNPEALHGPSLAYSSLPILWATSSQSYRDTRELSYRAVPLVFGMALILFTFGLAAGIGRGAALAAAALCAVSPSMIFYSRYFIHEMPLVLFSLVAIACGYQTLRRIGTGESAWGWSLATGASLGMMHATKETFVIAVAAAGLGILASVRWRRPPAAIYSHTLAAAIAAAAVSALFFSSFFTHAQGPIDSLATFSSYLKTGTDAASVHHHPWHWYLRLLVYQDRGGVLFNSEAVIVALACVGLVPIFRGRGLSADHLPLARFFAVYTVTMLVVYSAIPYKTPWCLLGALYGLIVLAGIGVVTLLQMARTPSTRFIVGALLLVLGGQLVYQNGLVNFRYESDERNPWVYAHALPDVQRLADLAKALSATEDPKAVPTLHVYNWTDNASLPFYLRDLPKTRFHRSNGVASASTNLDVIVIDEAHLGDLDETLANAFPYERFQMRPNIWARLYARPELWAASSIRPGAMPLPETND